jgi:predicted ester cyclase
MSAETTFRTYVTAFERTDLDALTSTYAEPTAYSQPFVTEPLTDRASIRAFEQAMFSGFSDIRLDVDWVVADNDSVAAGMTISCVHTGEMPLPDGGVLPPTGNKLVLQTAEYMRTNRAGLIIEHRRYSDTGSMLQQLTAPTN